MLSFSFTGSMITTYGLRFVKQSSDGMVPPPVASHPGSITVNFKSWIHIGHNEANEAVVTPGEAPRVKHHLAAIQVLVGHAPVSTEFAIFDRKRCSTRRNWGYISTQYILTNPFRAKYVVTDLKFVKKFTRPNFWAKEFYALKMLKLRLVLPATNRQNASFSVFWSSFGYN